MRWSDILPGSEYAYEPEPQRSRLSSGIPSRVLVLGFVAPDKVDDGVMRAWRGKVSQYVHVRFLDFVPREFSRPRDDERYVAPIQLIGRWEDVEPRFREALAKRKAEHDAAAAREEDISSAHGAVRAALKAALGGDLEDPYAPGVNSTQFSLSTDDARKLARVLSAVPGLSKLLRDCAADSLCRKYSGPGYCGDPECSAVLAVRLANVLEEVAR